MILQLKFSNSYSFYKETTIDFIASNQTELSRNYYTHDNNLRILKTIGVYGPNASGKSNIIKSIRDFQNFIIFSFKNEFKNLPFKPFLFSLDDLVEFELSFSVNNKQYKYGFSVSKEKVHYEWLYGQLNKNMVTIFDRENGNIKLHSSISKTYKDILDEVDLSEKTLLLSFLERFEKLKVIKEVYNFLTKGIFIIDDLNVDFQLERIKDFLVDDFVISNFKDDFINILNGFDLKIEDIKLEKPDPENDTRLYILYKYSKGKWINIDNESMGTKKLFTMLLGLYLLTSSETALFIDELDSHLHPLLTLNINKLVTELDNYSQMLFTAHDITLLENNILRRDQIYFTSKDEHGCSELTSLSQYKDENDNKIRKDVSYSNNYLQGIFGSVPNVNLNFLRNEEGLWVGEEHTQINYIKKEK